jgi:hypothetical protein
MDTPQLFFMASRRFSVIVAKNQFMSAIGRFDKTAGGEHLFSRH